MGEFHGFAMPRKKPWREPVESVPSDALSSEDVQASILIELDTGPKHKWELRTTLGINDARLLKELTTMRKRGIVRAFGLRSRERQWKLV